MGSVFLEVPQSAWVASNEFAFAFRDRYPVAEGHTLVVTRAVVTDWFAATPEQQLAVMQLVAKVKAQLDEEFKPAGYNVGFNAGAAAGQTVMHLHVHVIPRYTGDMDDPRGGVRHVIPSKGNYLQQVSPLSAGGENDPFSRHVLPLMVRAERIDIVAAFVQESGLVRLEASMLAALSRGAMVRILTGDYLDITQSTALELLLDWQESVHAGDESTRGRMEARVIEVASLSGRTRAFHPKSWRIEGPRFGVAWVGSSNLSYSALETGIEWNLRVDRDRDAEAWRKVGSAFEDLWSRARMLDGAWIDAYAKRVRASPVSLPPGELQPEVTQAPPEPHEVQLEALRALRESRQAGRRRALVVLATGLGKTWLAAFDYKQLREEIGRRPRLLFLAHRRELLRQAAGTYRRLLRTLDPTARVGWFNDERSELDADLVFASIPRLARAEHLEKLRQQRFDYVVVDEVHHAAADSYRRLLDCVDPGFLLGLTATPDRADGGDVAGLFDDHTPYQADIGRGVELKRLAPFHYFGIKDDVDYSNANIPWRNHRFDPTMLAAAVQTEQRMQTLWRAWGEHPGARSLVFCCSIEHAQFVRAWLRTQGVRVAAVFADEGSDDRDDALQKLERGELDAVCAVDLLNEGVDVPNVDRVIMLRPTESGVVFMQQLGRGLRASEGKPFVTIIDFVGNHRVFLSRLAALLSLSGSDRSVHGIVEQGPAPIELPAGCSIEIELEAVELLKHLYVSGGADEVERAYRELRLERDARPTAGELFRRGLLPSRLRARYGSWFRFVGSEGDSNEQERRVLEALGAFLEELEVTQMTRCFKMVTLEALLEAGGLSAGLEVRTLAQRSHSILSRTPALLADVPEGERANPSTRQWVAYWNKNPIAAWCESSWFTVNEGVFRFSRAVPADLEGAFSSMVRELVDYRLAQYRRRTLQAVTTSGFVCRVTWNQRDPILNLPSRAEDIPRGETEVRLPNGTIWSFRFAARFCNVAKPVAAPRNQLGDLLRSWFGATTGQPGTHAEVRFTRSPDGWWVAPVRSNVVELKPLKGVRAFPDLRAAAGYGLADVNEPAPDMVWLPGEFDDAQFAVRVVGTSMDGGKEPLRDGDWAVMRLARSAASSALEGRVVLVQVAGDEASQYLIKRLARRGSGWELHSDNPRGPMITPSEAMTVIARLTGVVRPEDLAPPEGTVVATKELGQVFGLESVPARTGRYHGHLFLLVAKKGQLATPSSARVTFEGARTGETAFVLTSGGSGRWRYAGVGRRAEDTSWTIPEVDFKTWSTLGEGRQVSRTLSPAFANAARALVDSALAAEHTVIVRPDGQTGRIIGRAPRGGLRIAGGPGGFAERTISIDDIGWTLAAQADVSANGGLLDEHRVNRLRYLAGTPKGSTRWIDAGWALGFVTELLAPKSRHD